MKWFIMMLAIASLSVGTAFASAPKKSTAGSADRLIDGYLAIQTALASDSLDGVKPAAEQMAGAAKTLRNKVPLLSSLPAQAEVLANAKDLAGARAAFKQVSTTVLQYVSATGNERKLTAFHCSMADASWLQAGEGTRNPYFGTEMLACGERAELAAPLAPGH